MTAFTIVEFDKVIDFYKKHVGVIPEELDPNYLNIEKVIEKLKAHPVLSLEAHGIIEDAEEVISKTITIKCTKSKAFPAGDLAIRNNKKLKLLTWKKIPEFVALVELYNTLGGEEKFSVIIQNTGVSIPGILCSLEGDLPNMTDDQLISFRLAVATMSKIAGVSIEKIPTMFPDALIEEVPVEPVVQPKKAKSILVPSQVITSLPGEMYGSDLTVKEPVKTPSKLVYTPPPMKKMSTKKKCIIGGVVAVVLITAGVVIYKAIRPINVDKK